MQNPNDSRSPAGQSIGSHAGTPTKNPSRIVVIGSNSFSGAHFVDHALSQGHTVIGASRSKEPIDAFLPYRKNVHRDRFQFRQFDLNHHLPQLMEAIDETEAEYVVNFAAQSMVAESWQNPDHWFMTNVVSNVKFHDQLRKRKFLKKYVHVSTPEVYGSCSGNITEHTNYNPSTPYAVSRAAADLSLMSFFKNYAFPVTFTRAANVYGPGQQLYRIIPKTLLSIKLGKKLSLHGGGHSIRSFIHIKDVAEGTLKVATDAEPGTIYHFSTTEQISIRDLVVRICAKMGAQFEQVVDIVGERPGKDAAYLLDSARAHKDLNWPASGKPISLEEGLQDTVRWMDANFEELRKQPHDYIHAP